MIKNAGSWALSPDLLDLNAPSEKPGSLNALDFQSDLGPHESFGNKFSAQIIA